MLSLDGVKGMKWTRKKKILICIVPFIVFFFGVSIYYSTSFNKSPETQFISDLKKKTDSLINHAIASPSTPKDLSNGKVEQLLKKANNGDIQAQYDIGDMYEWGKGVEQDSEKAIKWYTVAAEQGHIESQNALANLYNEQKDYSEAVKWWKKSADQGNAMGQANLGNMYMLGIGTEKNSTLALSLFRKAADQDWPYACYRLGVIYEKGIEVIQDYSKAFIWYEKAAKKDCVDAQNNLGILYKRGRGIEQNQSEALKWFQKAANQGSTTAYANIGDLYAFADGKTLQKDVHKAIEYWNKAADMGNAGAQFNLGAAYARGAGVEVDYIQAYKWIYLANENNDERIWQRTSAAKKQLESMMSTEDIAKAKKLIEEYIQEKPSKGADKSVQMTAVNEAVSPEDLRQFLKFNGVYRTEKINNSFWHYIRFYEDGTVITVNSSGTPDEIKSWFNKENITSDELPHGKYQVVGDKLIFSSVSKERTINYKGKIQESKLYLDIFSETNVRHGGGQFNFTAFSK